jgi:hypothetical protein
MSSSKVQVTVPTPTKVAPVPLGLGEAWVIGGLAGCAAATVCELPILLNLVKVSNPVASDARRGGESAVMQTTC